MESEDGWLRMMTEAVLSWSAYHANRHSDDVSLRSHIVQMPLLSEPAHTAATLNYAMKLVAKVTQHLHPGQTPVITMDQPLFCIAKEIHWAWPDIFDEDKFIVVMGGLHIEMNVMQLLGDILRDSWLTTFIVQSEITTSGRTDTVVKGRT